MSDITMNETLGNIFDAMNYATQQANNELIDPENRDMYLEDAIVLQVALDIIDKRFGKPDPMHWFWRGDHRD